MNNTKILSLHLTALSNNPLIFVFALTTHVAMGELVADFTILNIKDFNFNVNELSIIKKLKIKTNTKQKNINKKQKLVARKYDLLA